MGGWATDSFAKRIEIFIEPLYYTNVEYNLVVFVTIDSSLKPYIHNVYDICFVVDNVFVPFYAINLDKLEFLVSIPHISYDTITYILVYYDRLDFDFIIPNTENNLAFFVFGRYNSSHWHPNNSNELIYNAYNPTVLKGRYYQTSLNTSANYGDRFCYFVTTWFYVDINGDWWFAVDGDDAVEVEIDGVIVAYWYGGHGMCHCTNHNGSISLDVGWHILICRHEEGYGSQNLTLYYKYPSSYYWYTFSTLKLRCFRINHNDDFAKNRNFIVNGYSNVLLPFLYDMFPGLRIFNTLEDLTSEVGNDFISVHAALGQPVCDHIGIATDISVSSYIYVQESVYAPSSVVFFVNITYGAAFGRLVSFGNDVYIIVQSDGSLVCNYDATFFDINYRVEFNKCICFAVTHTGYKVDIICNGSCIYTFDYDVFLHNTYLGGYGEGNSISATFFYFFKFDYVDTVFIDYLYSSFLNSIVKLCGYDNKDIYLQLTVWPESIFVDDTYILIIDGYGFSKYSVYDYTTSSYLGVDIDYGLNLQHTFTKVGDCRLRVTYDGLQKFYTFKVSDIVNEFEDISTYLNTGSEVTNTVDYDINIDFTSMLATFIGYSDIVTEYDYGLISDYFYIDLPVEYIRYLFKYDTVVDVEVEYDFCNDVDTYFYNIVVFFKSSFLAAKYNIDMMVYLTLVAANYDTYDINCLFTSANWKYFDYFSSIIVSFYEVDNVSINLTTQSGLLQRYSGELTVSDYTDEDYFVDAVVSDMVTYDNFYYVETTSGTLCRFNADVWLSTYDIGSYVFEVKLNSIYFENFSIGLEDVINKVANYSVDVKDDFYSIDATSIGVWCNGITISGTTVSGINNGYTVFWEYDVFVSSSAEYYVFVVEAKNNYGDRALESFYIKRGYRYYYNVYRVTVHDYNELIPILITAENTVDIYPAYAAENLYVTVENMPYRGLTASIIPINLNKSSLTANITALSPNFYPGGEYEIRINCKDNDGNEMPEFVFSFKIRDDGT